jgi:hypothetical protein
MRRTARGFADADWEEAGRLGHPWNANGTLEGSPELMDEEEEPVV